VIKTEATGMNSVFVVLSLGLIQPLLIEFVNTNHETSIEDTPVSSTVRVNVKELPN
jgi:hypothetical protein